VRIAFSAPATSGEAAITAHEARDGHGGVLRVERGASGGLQDAAQTLSSNGRRGSDPRADVLAEQARASKAAQQSKLSEADPKEVERVTRLKELEAIHAGNRAPCYLTDPQKEEMEALQTAIRAARKQRGVIDSDDLAQRRAALQKKLGIYRS
jgi:hypothetical protein